MSAKTWNSFPLNMPTSALIGSLLLHALLPLLLMTLTYLSEQGLLPFSSSRKPEKNIYQNFIQVDVVELPTELISDKKRIDMSLPVLENPATAPDLVKSTVEEDTLADPDLAQPPTESDLKKAQEKRAAAERVIRDKKRNEEQEKALKRIQEDAAREAALKSLAPKDGKAGRSKQQGNVVSKGTSTSGKIGNAKDRYTGLVHEAIKEHFNIFPWQKKKKLIAVIRLEIFPTGRVRSKRILRQSADPIYDAAVLRAIDAAQPLPVPDEPSIIADGLDIEFTPE